MSVRALWARSTLTRIAVVLGVIALLAITMVITAGSMTERSAGRGAAINAAGSLRMQSYRLATEVASGSSGVAIAREIAEFDRRMNEVSRQISSRVPAAVEVAWRQIGDDWAANIRPGALESSRTAGAGRAFIDRLHPFVRRIDDVVQQIEADLETRITGLRMVLGATLVAVITLIVVAYTLLDRQVFRPIRALVGMTRRVRAGEFGVRATRVGADEIGELGRDFNHMVEELGRLYGSLESTIARKTAALEERNRDLALLYDTVRELSSAGAGEAALGRIAARMREVLGADGVVICARSSATPIGLPLAESEPVPGATCARVCCSECVDGPDAQAADFGEGADARRIVCVPLLDRDRRIGVMPVTLAAGQSLSPEQVELAQVVGRHVGAALASSEASEERRRLALLEERSAIARELHDSIAQSLSYTKIQLARLSSALASSRAPGSATVILGELREGVASAYRQLRELLATFRIQVAGPGVRGAVANAIEDVRARSGMAVELRDELVGIELSANEQVHVIQIIREALANVERHSGARHVWVALLRPRAGDPGTVEVRVEDDGHGIAVSDSPRNHFGLAIMRDRATALGGTLHIERRDVGGTGVRLAFVTTAARGRSEPAPVLAAAE